MDVPFPDVRPLQAAPPHEQFPALDRVATYLQLMGPQDHPSFAGQGDGFHTQNAKLAKACRDSLTQCLDNGWPTPWSLQLLEKVHRAMASDDPVELEAALLQVAAVSCAWMNDLNTEEVESES